jgi:hypothetical protein
MDPDILRTDITLFMSNFYDRIMSHYKSNTIYLIRYELYFLSTIGSHISNLTLLGRRLSEFTSELVLSDSIWHLPYFQIHISQQSLGIVNWFCDCNGNEYFDKKCFMFKIIKKILDPETINFISKDEYDMFKKIDSRIDPIITCSINKLLVSIYSIWEKNHEILIQKNNDHTKIFNKYNEILNKYKIPIYKFNEEFNKYKIPLYNCNQLNFNNLYDKTIFCPNNFHKLLLSSTTNENYDAYYEIFLYLKSYYDVISDDYYKPVKIKDTKVVKKQNNKKTEKVLNNDVDQLISKVKITTKKSIPVTLKRKVWNKYIGEEIGKATCLCCKLSTITQLSFHCGHIIAESKGGTLKMENLKPICQSCNSSMGTMDMDEYMQKFGF